VEHIQPPFRGSFNISELLAAPAFENRLSFPAAEAADHALRVLRKQ